MEARVEVLGPLRLLVDGVTVDVPGPKRRAVLALLALAEGRIVTVEHLVAALWPAQVPESGRQALHSHVFRLRAHLGAAADLLETTPDGYRLALGPGGLDLTQARMLLGRARAGVREDPAAAYTTLREAHGLWRGPVLADLTDVVRVVAAVQECAQLHREVTDALIGAAVAAGQADAVVGIATAAHDDDPLRDAYVAGEIENAEGNGEVAEGHYTRAIDLARSSGATFMVGVATVGLLTVRARAGRVHEALEGYREVVGYFARTGNWTHQWATLRNLADLLDRLGDHEPAALLHAAADQAPDAPAGAGPRTGAGVPVPSRGAVLDIARAAITRNLRP